MWGEKGPVPYSFFNHLNSFTIYSTDNCTFCAYIVPTLHPTINSNSYLGTEVKKGGGQSSDAAVGQMLCMRLT